MCETSKPSYKVRCFYGDNYEVYDANGDIEGNEGLPGTIFSGSLADCEAWIRLTESGRM
jgi:hypothetical protein